MEIASTLIVFITHVCQHVQLVCAVPVLLGFAGLYHCHHPNIRHSCALHSFSMG